MLLFGGDSQNHRDSALEQGCLCWFIECKTLGDFAFDEADLIFLPLHRAVGLCVII